MSDQIQVTDTNDGVATQVANPRRATLRTFMAAAFGLLVAVNAALPAIIDFLHAIEDAVVVPPWAYAAANGVAVVAAALIALVTRILALPSVNGWVEQWVPWLAPIAPTDGKHAAD